MGRPVLLVACTLALFTACATPQTQRVDPLDPGQLLVLSGFTVKVAATQEDLDQLTHIPQRELLRVTASNPPLYVYVDWVGCRCYYAGDESAYRRLEAMGFVSAWK